MAPELINSERFGLQFSRTPASDIYAFGCVCLEVYHRFPSCKMLQNAALFSIMGWTTTTACRTPAMSDALWQCLTAYGAGDPAAKRSRIKKLGVSTTLPSTLFTPPASPTSATSPEVSEDPPPPARYLVEVFAPNPITEDIVQPALEPESSTPPLYTYDPTSGIQGEVPEVVEDYGWWRVRQAYSLVGSASSIALMESSHINPLYCTYAAYTASYFDIGGSSFTPSGSSKIGGVVRQGEVSVKEDGMFATWI
ncbi:hypothetical protein B0H11DRAFT_2009978 [Mycena galericulata]|nr:hypothetical protein B0H11DRAFT_2009978 [Mycena galericulata]